MALLPLTDEAAGSLLQPLPEEEWLTSWHLVGPGGAVSSRGAAGVELLDALGHARLASLARPAEGLVEGAYTAIVCNCHRLGRLVPDGPCPRRFP